MASKDIEIKMAIKFNKDSVDGIKWAIAKGLTQGMKFIRDNFGNLIMTPMILGTAGWRGVEKTASWKWINSPAGFGQLGFYDAGEPLKLLALMFDSYKVTVHSTIGKTQTNLRLKMEFFDIDALSRGTRSNPSAGELGLSGDRSWFDWVYKGRAITEPANFVKTGPRKGARSSVIAGAHAGLMKDKGSGLWSVPPKYRLDLEQVVRNNEDKIAKVIEQTLVKQLKAYMAR